MAVVAALIGLPLGGPFREPPTAVQPNPGSPTVEGRAVSTTLVMAFPAAPAVDPVTVSPDEVEVHADYRHEVDLPDGEIDVEVAIDLSFDKPSERVNRGVIDYFLTQWFTIVPSGAAAIAGFDDIGPLSVELVESDEAPGLQIAAVDLRGNLSSGRSTGFTLTYSLPSAPPPVELEAAGNLLLEDQVVVNRAAVGWAFFTDPGLDSWTAEISLPEGFDPPPGIDEKWSVEDRVLRSNGSDFVYDYVVAENDSAMGQEVVEIQGSRITVRYWPGDLAWRDLVIEQIEEGLPRLVDLVGRPWPDRPLVVQQSAETLGTSYGGWYANGEHAITIGPSVNDELILHELSHVWFNYNNLGDRWLVEGLADEFASLAVDGGSENPAPVSRTDEHAIALRAWFPPDDIEAAEPDAAEAEQWGYDASWMTIRQVRELIGTEAFTETVRTVLDGGRSYPGPGSDQQIFRRSAIDPSGNGTIGPGWRQFLDLAADHGDEEELSRLFADWVEGSWTGRFDRRTGARVRYRTLADRADGFILPEAVRRSMRDWSFPQAEAAMERTDEFLDDLERLRLRLAQRGLALPDDVGDRLAEAPTIDDIDRYGADLTATGDEIVAFVDRSSALTAIERVGLVGGNLDGIRRDAVLAFDRGDLAGATRSVDIGRSRIAGARSSGSFRLSVALLIVLVAAGLLIGSRRRRRHVFFAPGTRRHPVTGNGSPEPVRSPTAPGSDDSDGSSPSHRCRGAEPSSPSIQTESSDPTTTSQRS